MLSRGTDKYFMTWRNADFATVSYWTITFLTICHNPRTISKSYFTLTISYIPWVISLTLYNLKSRWPLRATEFSIVFHQLHAFTFLESIVFARNFCGRFYEHVSQCHWPKRRDFVHLKREFPLPNEEKQVRVASSQRQVVWSFGSPSENVRFNHFKDWFAIYRHVPCASCDSPHGRDQPQLVDSRTYQCCNHCK